jgi:hypothetical protein
MLALLLALTALGGCGQPAVSFNNKLAALEKRIESPAKAVRAHFTAYWNKKEFDGVRAEADYDALLAAVDQVIADIKATKPPGNVKLAGEFHAAFLAFYNEQRAIVTKDIRPGLDALKDEAMPEEKKVTLLRSIEAGMETRAAESTQKLQAVQQRYAAANNMQMKATP